MKKTVIKSLRTLFSNEKTFLKTKDTVFCNAAEHLYRTSAFIKKYYHKKTNLAILDVGAADGGSAHYFSSHFPESTIIAFEPLKSAFMIASETNRGNNKIILRNIALHDKIGTETINVSRNSFSSSLHNFSSEEIEKESAEQRTKFEVTSIEEISVSTLDEEAKNLSEILLIKIDTQGTELKILEHGIETLRKTHLLLIEMPNSGLYEKGCMYYELDEFLRKKNFRLIDIIVTYRAGGIMKEYDALYENTELL